MFIYDPVSPVAMEISEETCLLCFDEFQVSNRLIEAICALVCVSILMLQYLPTASLCNIVRCGADTSVYHCRESSVLLGFK